VDSEWPQSACNVGIPIEAAAAQRGYTVPPILIFRLSWPLAEKLFRLYELCGYCCWQTRNSVVM